MADKTPPIILKYERCRSIALSCSSNLYECLSSRPFIFWSSYNILDIFPSSSPSSRISSLSIMDPPSGWPAEFCRSPGSDSAQLAHRIRNSAHRHNPLVHVHQIGLIALPVLGSLHSDVLSNRQHSSPLCIQQ